VIRATFIGLAAAIALAAPADAQQAPPAKPSRTLISVGYGSNFGMFVETPLASSGGKVEAWIWNILNAPRTIPGATFDMTVSREVIDCAEWTRTQLYTDGFLGETYLSRSPGEGRTEAITGGATAAYAKILCGKVDLSKDAPIADVAAARALTAKHFAAPQ
jgi:hypothetical protein